MAEPPRSALKSDAMSVLRGMKFMKRNEEQKRVENLRAAAAAATTGTSGVSSSNQKSSGGAAAAAAASSSSDIPSAVSSGGPSVLSMADLQQMRILTVGQDAQSARRKFVGGDVVSEAATSAMLADAPLPNALAGGDDDDHPANGNSIPHEKQKKVKQSKKNLPRRRQRDEPDAKEDEQDEGNATNVEEDEVTIEDGGLFDLL